MFVPKLPAFKGLNKVALDKRMKELKEEFNQYNKESDPDYKKKLETFLNNELLDDFQTKLFGG
jgi:hypothetical protein